MISGIDAMVFIYAILAVVAICFLLFLYTPAGRYWKKKL